MDKYSVDQRSTFSALAHHFGAKPNISKALSDCITPR